MINRVTGEVTFQDGLYIRPYHAIELPHRTRKLSLKSWTRHILGVHASEHGEFEVEALSTGMDCIQLVLLAHRHTFYKLETPEDAERRAFHEGVINADLVGQREFSWGEVICRFDTIDHKNWIVVAYNRAAEIPRGGRDILLTLFAHERIPDEGH